MSELSRATVPPGAVVVSREACDSDDPLEVVYSLVQVVNDLFAALLTDEEIGEASLGHYFLDYYVAQVNNGGHSQFLSNLGSGRAAVFRLVDQAMADVDLPAAREIWEEFGHRLDQIPAQELGAFLEDGYVDADGFHPLEQLNALDDAFYDGVGDRLAEANAAFLRSRPDLVALPEPEIAAYVATRRAALPDLAEREAAAREAEPSYIKAARTYCSEHGLEFDRVTAGNGVKVDGQSLIEWYFLAEGGLYSLIEHPGGSVTVATKDRPVP